MGPRWNSAGIGRLRMTLPQLTGRYRDRPAGPRRRLSRRGRLLVKAAAVLSAPLFTLTGVFALPSHAAVPQGFQTGHGPALTGWLGEYWNDGGGIPSIPTTPPDLVRMDPELSFDWGEGSPAPQITPDHFMTRWTRTDVLPAGLYRFTGAMDDGIRVYVDNNPIVDRWTLQNATFSVDRVLRGGPHVFRVEYFENTAEAKAVLDYQRIGHVVPTDPGWSAEYYDNPNLTGTPVLTRMDQDINFDWGEGSPDAGVPADHFSARWTKSIKFAAGTYAFTATADDGVRLYIDGSLVLDKWVLEGLTTYTVNKQLSAGTHRIVMEYFENTGGAVAKLSYAPTA